MPSQIDRRIATTLLVVCAASACGGGEAVPPTDMLTVPYVIFAPPEAEEVSTPFRMSGEARHCLCLPPPAEFRYRMPVPERGLLTFAIGVESVQPIEEVSAIEGESVSFVVKAGLEIPDKEIFRREVSLARRDRWIEQSIDLRDFAGEEPWLSFETESSSDEVLGLFAEPVLHDRAYFAEGRGVVVVSIDTLRRDHTSLHGYRRRTTPSLASFADTATVFEDAISTSSWTLPAHASLFTSSYPSRHGAVSYQTSLSREVPNLVEILHERGFFTAGLVTHLYLSSRYGLDAGFETHRLYDQSRAAELVDEAIGFLQSKGDRDYFLFVHLYDPHWHYDPPPPFDRQFDPNYSGEANGVWWEFKEQTRETISDADLAHIRALYDGEIAYTDRQLGRLFREMKRLRVFDKSLIVVTSDHGEEFLEHGGWEHQKTLYEEQLRVPLMLKLPGQTRASRENVPVSLIDVAPTILETYSIPLPASFQGKSLRGVALGQNRPARRELWAETEHTVDGSHLLSLRRGADGRKIIYARGDGKPSMRFFDLDVDPMESSEVAVSDVERGAASDRLRLYISEMTKPRREGAPVELTDEEIQRLRALGYIQ